MALKLASSDGSLPVLFCHTSKRAVILQKVLCIYATDFVENGQLLMSSIKKTLLGSRSILNIMKVKVTGEGAYKRLS